MLSNSRYGSAISGKPQIAKRPELGGADVCETRLFSSLGISAHLASPADPLNEKDASPGWEACPPSHARC